VAGWAARNPFAGVEQLCNPGVDKAIDVPPALRVDLHQSAFKEALQMVGCIRWAQPTGASQLTGRPRPVP